MKKPCSETTSTPRHAKDSSLISQISDFPAIDYLKQAGILLPNQTRQFGRKMLSSISDYKTSMLSSIPDYIKHPYTPRSGAAIGFFERFRTRYEAKDEAARKLGFVCCGNPEVIVWPHGLSEYTCRRCGALALNASSGFRF